MTLTGCGGVLANKPESGTVVIDEFGEEHQRTGKPIVYTSVDSVFQIAAHKETIPLEELYRLCSAAREKVCVGDHADPEGFARALEEFDAAVPELLDALPSGGRLVITADHGNDPTTAGTDHSREYVPLLVYDGSGDAT